MDIFLGILYAIAIFGLLITSIVFMFKKVNTHRSYLRLLKSLTTGIPISQIPHFTFSNSASVLLPFITRNHKIEKKDKDLKKLGEQTRKYRNFQLWFFFSPILLQIVLAIIITIWDSVGSQPHRFDGVKEFDMEVFQAKPAVTGYFEGEPDGVQKKYHDNGRVFQEAPFLGGYIHGVLKEYSDGGLLLEAIPMERGVNNGLTKTYYNTGDIQFEGNYLYGYYNGEIKLYYKFNVLKEKSNWENGVPNGTYELYNEDRELIESGSYVDGVKQQN